MLHMCEKIHQDNKKTWGVIYLYTKYPDILPGMLKWCIENIDGNILLLTEEDYLKRR